MLPSRAKPVVGLAALAATYLTAGMVYLLVQPGFTASRGAFVAVVVCLGWVGAGGVATGRRVLLLGGAVGLVALGFWQAVAWLFMLPTAAVFLVVALVGPDDRERSGASANARS
jgi:hypothetical protein